MLQRIRDARLFWPTLFAIAGVAFLLGLGKWQLDRKAWKEGLIARLEAGAKAEPVELKDALSATDGDLTKIEFRRVRVRGRFRHDEEFHVWAPAPQAPGWSIVTPLHIARPNSRENDPPAVLFVIRGVVPDALKDRTTRQNGQLGGEVDIVGRVRLDRPAPFVSPPETGTNVWLARDLDEMARRTGADSDAYPVFIEAEQPSGGQGAPVPRLDALSLTNRHLEYALTWFGLAATLAAVYAVFAFGRLRPDADPPRSSDSA